MGHAIVGRSIIPPVNPLSYTSSPTSRRSPPSRRRRFVHINASKVLPARGVDCESHVRFGLPADEIIAAAAELGAERLVMGSHGHGAIYHLFTGSVVTGVLKRSGCPVLVVPLRDQAK